MKRADAIWNKGPELIDDDGEVRELTVEDFKRFVPFSELPESLQFKLQEIQRGNFVICPDPVQKPVSVMLAPELAEALTATSDDLDGRVNEVVREWLETQKAS
jgi:uncharacterized protein (DUF4415 family)